MGDLTTTLWTEQLEIFVIVQMTKGQYMIEHLSEQTVLIKVILHMVVPWNFVVVT